MYFGQRVREPGLREHLDSVQLRDGLHLFGCYLADAETLRRFSEGVELNRDNRPVVAFLAPRQSHRPKAAPYGCLALVLKNASAPPAGLFKAGSEQFTEELGRFISARQSYLAGLIAEAEGREAEAIDAFVESARRSSAFLAGYAQVLTIAVQKARDDPEVARELLRRLSQARPERDVAVRLLERLFEK
jgi:spermidine synthase